jgi:L-fucose isomerase-like protein
MNQKKTTFALMLANRGFFPGSLMDAAREELTETLADLGHQVIMMPKESTRFGAVETPEEGKLFARFLHENKGEFGGVIVSLPNFGDENGAVEALKDAGVPILIHAYPDELDKMAPENRRDAFCGKLSIMDVLKQNNVPFTALKPHVVSPKSDRFKENIAYFDKVCSVAGGVKGMRVGAIGARTTAFKTVRIDELALQKHGITMETVDLSDVFKRMRDIDPAGNEYKNKKEKLTGIGSWKDVPDTATDNLTRLAVVLEQLADEMELDAMAVRCWIEMQEQLGISPCVVLGELIDSGIPAACEVDVGNAVTMYALSLASGKSATCLDWNNNYGEDDDRCILFHCGPVPESLMAGRGRVTDHAILQNAVGKGCSYGCNQGRIAAGQFSFGSLTTVDGRISCYLGTGEFTTDEIPKEFFGCAGVAKIPGLQDVLLHVGRNGHRHHVSVTPGNVIMPVREALSYYLGFDISLPGRE